MRKLITIAALLVGCSLGVLPGVTANAQVPTAHPRSPETGRYIKTAPPVAGNIIGDKNTKVYHLPGDRGTLPMEKNRVYFRTEAEAVAAGFRHAGSKATDHRTLPARDPRTGRFIKTPPSK